MHIVQFSLVCLLIGLLEKVLPQDRKILFLFLFVVTRYISFAMLNEQWLVLVCHVRCYCSSLNGVFRFHWFTIGEKKGTQCAHISEGTSLSSCQNWSAESASSQMEQFETKFSHVQYQQESIGY